MFTIRQSPINLVNKGRFQAVWGVLTGIFAGVIVGYIKDSAPRAGHDIRMSSFFDYGYWICEIQKEDSGEAFCNVYIALLERQLKGFRKNTDLIEQMKGFLEGYDLQWEGTMSELLTGLKDTKKLLVEIYEDRKFHSPQIGYQEK